MGRPPHVARTLTALTAAALALTATACSGGGQQGSSGSGGGGAKKGDKSLTIATAAEVARLNPSNDNGTTGIQIEAAIWAPLVRTNSETGKLDYVVAKSITSKDAKTWTIKLNPGWTFTNGEKLTAKSFVDTWNYTAYGPHAFLNNGFFQRVQGYDAMNPQKGKPTATTLSGLKVIDDLTFQVTLKSAFSPYPVTLQYLGGAALASEVLKDPAKYDHNPIGYGPYKVSPAWKAGQPVSLVRNKSYPLKDVPEADKITFRWFSNPETGYNEFLAGNVDYTAVPSTKMSAFKSDAAGKWAQSKSAGNVYYLSPSIHKPDFKNPKVREALSLALDRASLSKLVAGASPATGYVAPGIVGYRADSCKVCAKDIAKAKKLLAEGGGFKGTLAFYYNSDNPGAQVFAEAVGNMWRQNLGIKMKYVGKPSSEITALSDKHQLDGVRVTGWGHDYPSIEDYLTPIFASYGDANFNQYSNPKVDKDLDDANGTADQDAAIAKYQAVEDEILADLPEIPVYRLQSPYLKGDGVEPRNSVYTGVDPIWSKISR